MAPAFFGFTPLWSPRLFKRGGARHARMMSAAKPSLPLLHRPGPTIALAIVIGGLGIGITRALQRPQGPATATTQAPRRAALDDEQAAAFGAYIRARFRGLDAKRPAADWLDSPASVFIAARADGKRLARAWADDITTDAAIDAALAALQRKLSRRTQASPTTLQVDLIHDVDVINLRTERAKVSNLYRGLHGLELRYGDQRRRWAPSTLLAQNLAFGKLLDRFQDKHGLGRAALVGPGVEVRTFDADQLLIPLDDSPTWRMVRGNRVVPIEDVTRDNVIALVEAQIGWMHNNLHDDGRMTYKYWPSRGQEAKSNNMIRQWMATVCLNRIARHRGDAQALYDLSARNIRYNLDTFFSQEGDYGLITFREKVKLGAVALAALSIFEHPERERFRAELNALRKTVDALWQSDGSFHSFFKKPAHVSQSENQNFYPGEALVFWAALYDADPDPALLDRFMKSFRYYRDWHLNPIHRNPAFIPWHTQADYAIWRHTQDPELAAFIFEINDWLIDTMQQWDEDPAFPDTQGRFYSRTRPFGPPHASSTGVYLEGLIDAYRLARTLHDTSRAEKYRTAMIRAMRSLMQLTFLDDVDLYYVHDRARVRGGVRTTVYDNVIRVDNVQHGLMGMLKVLATLEPGDYRP